jgi:tetratricopeptide (TPR) repeat protein
VAELARGTIADRPWGRTLAALGLRGATGELTVTADNKRYQVAFMRGAVVAAASPLASDAAVRIALTAGLVSSSQVADIARRQAAAPQRDEIELIAELVRLGPDHALRLRRRAVAHRAARTFALDRGEFVVDDRTTLRVVQGGELDVRSVIYLGARQHLSETRLAVDLSKLGAWFKLTAAGVEDLPQFGFGADEQPVLRRLQHGGTLADLAVDSDPRLAQAVVYALVSCNACEVGSAPPASRTASGPMPATRPSGSVPTTTRSSGTMPRARTQPPANAAQAQRKSQPSMRVAVARKVDPAQSAQVQQLIAAKLGQLAREADHFAVFGISADASPDQIRKAYFNLARQLHPDRLAALGIADDNRDAQRLFAHVNRAFAQLSDPRELAAYRDIVARGGEAVLRAEQQQAEEMAKRIIDAEEAFRRAEAAVSRDQFSLAMIELTRATQLNPGEPDYQALYTWVQFVSSDDKVAMAGRTRLALERVISQAPQAIEARFYLGRLERMVGRDDVALRLFQEVLRAEPRHTEAAGELRMLESRRRR